MQLENAFGFAFNGALACLLVLFKPASATPNLLYHNSTIVAVDGQPIPAIRPRMAQRPPTRFACEDYTCAATKIVQTTIGGQCTRVCQDNCNTLIRLAAKGPIALCSLDDKAQVSAGAATGVSVLVDPICNCKYCKCVCQYDIDNVANVGLDTCKPEPLCKVISNSARGWTFTSGVAHTPYPCRFPPAKLSSSKGIEGDLPKLRRRSELGKLG
ncbi:hypothetical protein CTRI78_v003719 [Colletotrichum trifolii]|uniref:Uncharacterized protein n=1 Tax=Colletotrichum trifolii TaxID=5466 RepID=A0A4R8RIP4_COLTR|nr:hypothetical protein CTRI78_v003719 [Colletotrichum trifolii]